jgi:hypothetical protein
VLFGVLGAAIGVPEAVLLDAALLGLVSLVLLAVVARSIR